MGIIDLFIAAALVYGFYKGFKNGLFVELASFVAFFVGIYIAIKFSSVLGDFLKELFSWPPKTTQVIAFVLTLGVVVVVIHLLAKVLSGIANFAFLGWANTLAGGAFGALKTAILLGIVFNLFQKVNVNDMLVSKETQESSLFFNPCMKTSETLLPVLSHWFTELKTKTKEWEKKEDTNETAKDSLS